LDEYLPEKRKEIQDAFKNFIELGIIQSSPFPMTNEAMVSKEHLNLPEKNIFKEPYLTKLMINITEKCNLQCKHCYLTNKKQQDIAIEDLIKLIRDFYELHGLRIILTGGEPFLYGNLKQLLLFLKKVPLQKVLLTNGTLIKQKKELLPLLKENYFEVFVSLDGLKDTHDEFRNVKCFQDTIEGIKLLLHHDIHVTINTMIHARNVNEFNALKQFIKNLGPIKNWILDIPTYDESIPKDIREKYAISGKKGAEVLKSYGWGVFYESETSFKDLACGPNIMAIDVLGNISKCGFFSENDLGNVFELGVKQSWRKIQERLNWNIKDLKCFEINCEFLNQCRGGCRYRAYVETGDVLGEDIYMCYRYGRLPKNEKNP